MPAEALLQRARIVAERAYAPYSRFKVGAALLTSDGSVIVGCNVENSSYGMASCAERNAVASMIAMGHFDPVAIAVVGESPARPARPAALAGKCWRSSTQTCWWCWNPPTKSSS
jgi:cytidine deaminase